MKNRKCPQCGTEYSKGAKFCPKCGYDLTKISRTNNLRPRWTWYLGVIILVVILGWALYCVISSTVDYQNILHQSYTGTTYQNEYGSQISDDLSDTYGFAAFCFFISLLWLLIKFARRIKQPFKVKLIAIILIQVLTTGILILNFNNHHQFSLSSSKLGEAYTKETLSGTIWRYSYFKNKEDQDDDSGDYKNQITRDVAGNKYSHVFLKFNDDGSLGVNVNPYWLDGDDKAYENSQNSDYRTVGTWRVSSDGKVDLSWNDADTGAYKYETVRVKIKKKHHRKHHKKYKYKYKEQLTPQFVDAYGDPDTSLPRYFPGDDIHGNVGFGVKTIKIHDVILQKPNKDGDVNSINE